MRLTSLFYHWRWKQDVPPKHWKRSSILYNPKSVRHENLKVMRKWLCTILISLSFLWENFQSMRWLFYVIDHCSSDARFGLWETSHIKGKWKERGSSSSLFPCCAFRIENISPGLLTLFSTAHSTLIVQHRGPQCVNETIYWNITAVD